MSEAEVGTKGAELVVPESKAVVETSAHAISEREKAEVGAAYIKAYEFPRNEATARVKILATCEHPGFAETARYGKPIGGGKVYGLSVRFAEEMARLWGNIRTKSAIVFDDENRRIYTVSAIDLETNAGTTQDLVVEKTVERKNTKKGDEVLSSRQNSYGETVYVKRATDDEVMVKANAQLSKIKRNLLLSLIPAHIREEAEAQVVRTMADRDAKDPEGETKKLHAAFFKLGVMPNDVQQLLGKPLEQMNPADLGLLRQAYTALKDQEATWEEIVADPAFKKAPAKDGKKKQTMAQKVKAKAESVKKAQNLNEETGELTETEDEEQRAIDAEEVAKDR